MKKCLLSLLLALSVTLTGCASMLDRSELFITPHNQAPAAEGDSSIYQVENYQELVSAILYFVLQGQEEGTLRMYNYEQDVDADLNAACLEVAQEDPIGAYALDYIKFEAVHILNYYEVQLDFGYRRTQAQVDSIVSVVGTNAIRQELCEALDEFRTEVVLRISYFDRSEAYLRTLVREAYYDTPQSAFGLPQAEISIYPESGPQRVVEFQLTYPNTTERMRTMQSRVLGRAEIDTTDLYMQLPEYAFQQIAELLREEYGYTRNGTASLQFILSGAAPSSEGLALAMCVYGQSLDLSCQVVKGTLNGVPHFWNIVSTSTGYRHLDPTLEEPRFSSDSYMTQQGYSWVGSSLPTCIDPSENLPGLLPELPDLPEHPELPELPDLPDPENNSQDFRENT